MTSHVKCITNSTAQGLTSELNEFLGTSPGVIRDIKYLESVTAKVSAMGTPMGTPNKQFIAFVHYEK